MTKALVNAICRSFDDTKKAYDSFLQSVRRPSNFGVTPQQIIEHSTLIKRYKKGDSVLGGVLDGVVGLEGIEVRGIESRELLDGASVTVTAMVDFDLMLNEFTGRAFITGPHGFPAILNLPSGVFEVSCTNNSGEQCDADIRIDIFKIYADLSPVSDYNIKV